MIRKSPTINALRWRIFRVACVVGEVGKMKKAAGIVNIDDYLYESWKETSSDEGEE